MALPAGRYGVTKRQLNKIKNLPINTIRMIQEALKTSKEYTDDAIGWGSKNKLPPRVSSGIFTVNNDGSITIDTGGAPVEENTDFLLFQSNLPLDNGNWIISFNSNSTEIRYRYMDTPSSEIVTKNVSEESTITIGTGKLYFLYLRVPNGTTVNNVTVYPMISKDGGAYAPYHASVDATKADNSVIGTVEDGENPTRSYVVGEHMIRGGKFCTVTVPVNTSSTWSEGSNYISGDVADELNREVYTDTFTFGGVTCNYTIQRVGRNISLTIDVQNATFINGSNTLFTLPSAYRPLTNNRTFAGVGRDGATWSTASYLNFVFRVATDGVVTIVGDNIATMKYVSLSVEFII